MTKKKPMKILKAFLGRESQAKDILSYS